MTWLAIKAFLGGVPAWVWKLLGALAVGAGIFLSGAHWQAGRDAGKIRAADQRTEAVRKEYAGFVANVEEQGKAAARRAREIEQADKARKEKADADYTKTLADLRADNDRLRKSRPPGSYLPPAAPAAIDPDRICFSRAKLDAAFQRLDDGVSGLLGEGDAGIAGLNTARQAWPK